MARLQRGEASLTAVSRVLATLATDEHADSVAAFFRAAWGENLTAEVVLAGWRKAAAENGAAPGEVPPTAIVLEGSRVIGYCGSIPHRLWDGVAEHPAYWVKGLMVLPEYRRGPIGFLVGKELATQLTRTTALVVAPAARRLFSALGYTDLGAVTNFVRPLRLASLARRLDAAELGLGLPRWLTAGVRVAQRAGVARLAGGVVGLALDVAAGARGRAPSWLTTACAVDLPSRDELDELWHDARGAMAASPVRDGMYLRWRYGADAAEGGAAENRYSFITARDGQRLVGVAALLRPKAMSDPRLRGAHVATISDIVFAPGHTDVGLAVLAGVERVARSAGADAVLCTTSHRALARLLSRRSYLPLPGNVHFFLRDVSASARWPRDLASWWLARGDSAADEVF
ncbi:MAG: hypothetical protein DMD59_04955 [Gemmatimonadetes bacterium]|nr:MAG: hypothetical protein DMD59_04955 [Gemmatimonadota bacterium]